MGFSEEQVQEAILELSEKFNKNNAFTTIQDLAKEKFGKDIDNDSFFWHDLEETIIHKIINHEE